MTLNELYCHFWENNIKGVVMKKLMILYIILNSTLFSVVRELSLKEIPFIVYKLYKLREPTHTTNAHCIPRFNRLEDFQLLIAKMESFSPENTKEETHYFSFENDDDVPEIFNRIPSKSIWSISWYCIKKYHIYELPNKDQNTQENFEGFYKNHSDIKNYRSLRKSNPLYSF
jgi:hypothetical protein